MSVPLSDIIVQGEPLLVMIASQFLVNLRRDGNVSANNAMHTCVKSSTTVSMRKLLPSEKAPLTESRLHCALGRDGNTNGRLAPRARLKRTVGKDL
ncbi:hypothetical protein J2782_003971 [Brucella pseudogrignonensis]|uniref:Uncharacterized protein n=1 Tax=Brucella pseudogrignonensis TaxID=419475 RepID=A0ABU1MDU5_9HYPH|nr:hypothetical protein [Brucella pseudogrignonensis]